MRVNELPMASKLEGPLKGIKVVDFTHVLAGPYATALLADLGANVIKLERFSGDTIRRFGPIKSGQSGYYIQLNRGKRNICIDLTRPEAKEIINKMVQESDIVVENFMVGAMSKLGYGYEQLSEWNPRIIMCSISINGQYGPESRVPGFDIVAQGRGGLMSVTGYPDGPPTKVGVSIGDMNCGVHAVAAILAALHEREISGKGQYIDIAMSDCVLRVNEHALPYYFMEGENPPRSGNAHPAAGPYSVFQTRDGWLIIACVSDPTWERLLVASGHPEWNDDPRFNTNLKRGKNRYELQKAIDAWLSHYTTEEAVEILTKNKVPHSPVFSFSDIAVNEQFNVRDMVVTLEQPIVGDVIVAGNVFKFSRTPAKIQGRTALLGENNEDVLQDFGYSTKEIQSLYNAEVIKKPMV